MKTTIQWLGATVALGISCICGAQPAAFPAKPIRLIVPYAPGGVADLMSRIIAQRLGTLYNQQVIVDNRPGSGGHVGALIHPADTSGTPPDMRLQVNQDR